MTTLKSVSKRRAATAFALALCLLTSVAALPVQAQFGRKQAPAAGMSKGKKVAMVAGAALLYYLYRKHTANQKTQQAQQPVRPGLGGVANTRNTVARRPQLYRSKNGGVYYRDARNKPVWLTVPNRPVQVPLSELQRYAPDYQRYRGPAPSAPAGYRSQSYSEFDPAMARVFGGNGGSSMGNGGSTLPGPRGGGR